MKEKKIREEKFRVKIRGNFREKKIREKVREMVRKKKNIYNF